MVLLQYVYNGVPEDIKVEPHKNAKKSATPSYGTAKSTREKMAERAKTALDGHRFMMEVGLSTNLPHVPFQEVFRKSNMKEESVKSSTAKMHWQS